MAIDWGLVGAGAAGIPSLIVGGPAAGAVGAGLGGSVGSMFNKRKRPKINIEGELAKISALYDTARTSTSAGIAKQLGELNRGTASNLAGRGIYDSPVGEYAFAANREKAQTALANALAGIGTQEAGVRGSLLERLTGLKYQADLEDEQAKEQRMSQLYGILAGLGAGGLSKGSSGGAQTYAA